MEYNITWLETIEIKNIVLDLNWTLAVNWKIVDGVKKCIENLKKLNIEVLLFTWDQRGNVENICKELWITFKVAKNAQEKEKLFLELDINKTVAIWNARIDNGMFKHAKISIAKLQAEWIHTWILGEVDIIIPNIVDALNLFIDSDSLEATLKI